ncbi:MAG: DUF3307 domain-containing protein [Eubacteriales bacterium]
MELLILGHVLGDFYFQTDQLADRKKISIEYGMMHGGIYAFIVGILLILQVSSVKLWMGIVFVTFLDHVVVDYVKVLIERKYESYKCQIFCWDQMFHVISLFGISYVFELNCSIENIAILISALICWKPASIFIALVLEQFKLIDIEEENKNQEICDIGVAKSGMYIGVLEREIILLLGVIGQGSAIGFVLAAKSIARYKQLEAKNFAEKYLIGTLLSALISILCIVVCTVLT